MLQCVILAGGLGTRMRPSTEEMPKALLPVLGKPFADWQLELLAERGIERVIYSVGFKGEMIREHVGDGSRWGLTIKYVDEGSRLRGTGGAVRLAYDLGELEDEFFVIWGDSYLPTDFAAVERAWKQTDLPALMTVYRNENRWDPSNAIYEDGRVVLYDKDRPADRAGEMHWIDYGLSAFNQDPIAARCPPDGVMDLAEVMRELSREGELAGFEVSERFYEGGSPEGLAELEEYLSKQAI
jgi:NDP-sugar pyrophosphorylase family protein